jgi:hypothetical protein
MSSETKQPELKPIPEIENAIDERIGHPARNSEFKLTADMKDAIDARIDRHYTRMFLILGTLNIVALLGGIWYAYFELPKEATKQAIESAQPKIDAAIRSALDRSKGRIDDLSRDADVETDKMLQSFGEVQRVIGRSDELSRRLGEYEGAMADFSHRQQEISDQLHRLDESRKANPAEFDKNVQDLLRLIQTHPDIVDLSQLAALQDQLNDETVHREDDSKAVFDAMTEEVMGGGAGLHLLASETVQKLLLLREKYDATVLNRDIKKLDRAVKQARDSQKEAQKAADSQPSRSP